jgi:hypothetical protein
MRQVLHCGVASLLPVALHYLTQISQRNVLQSGRFLTINADNSPLNHLPVLISWYRYFSLSITSKRQILQHPGERRPYSVVRFLRVPRSLQLNCGAMSHVSGTPTRNTPIGSPPRPTCSPRNIMSLAIRITRSYVSSHWTAGFLYILL